MNKKLKIPEMLSSKTWLIEKHIEPLNHALKESCVKLILVSDYAGKNLSILLTLLDKKWCGTCLSRAEYFSFIEQISLTESQASFSAALRQFRNEHLLHLLILEHANRITTEQSTRAWSDCADAIISHSLSYCQKVIASRYGIPKDEEGKEVALYTLAMGKLGGMELNYSSDIDLIFTYSKAGTSTGDEPISAQQFYSKVVQLFLQMLQNKTPQGFVFRVDLRLRPNGESGPLVFSLAAMETYYQEQGRDWERYAMVKARVIQPSLEPDCTWFNHLIVPFVYRRYVDFSVIESLRSMKSMIQREVQLNPRLNDIKRGQGGIREVEFIIQSIQLIRGGRLPQLRAQNAITALNSIKLEQLLPRGDVLKQAYLFLRRLENVLQSLDDQQTHSLPEDLIKKTQVVLAMGFKDWAELEEKLHQYQRIISNSFQNIMGEVKEYEDAQRLLNNQLSSIWHGHAETSMAINLLTSLGFVNAEHCYQMLISFRNGSRCRRLTQAARIRLDRFMVLLLAELTQYQSTDAVLLQVIHLLENIVGRSAYLALLTENRKAFKEFLFWFSQSPYVTALLVSHPFLLEVLLDQQEDWQPISRKELEKKLKMQLLHASEMEAKEDILRQFKLTHWLMTARAEVYGFSTAVRLGTFLADVTEVIVRQAYHLAAEQLALRYPEMKSTAAHFAVIAYGKLGSREMNYASDLDLVFLYTSNSTEEALLTRLTQKIVRTLTTRTQAGILYSVDTRLRPSGSAGLLVSSLEAFTEYQKNQAWTWEHQALLKARVLCGSPEIKKQLLSLKQEIVTRFKDPITLKQDVLEMRSKINLHHSEKENLNSYASRLIDLEFLIQYLVLSARDSDLARLTNPLTQLKKLMQINILSLEGYQLLKNAYQYYHALLHQQLIFSTVNKPPEEAFETKLSALFQELYKN